jgi:hypothetical protein
MDTRMCHVLRAETEMEHRKTLGAGIDGQPEPQHLFGVAQPGASFVHLKVRKVEVVEGVPVQRLRVLKSTGQPQSDGGMTRAEDARSLAKIQPTSRAPSIRWRPGTGGGFQTEQGGVAPGSESRVAGRASKGLDLRSRTMLAIPKEAHERERR